MGYDDLLVDCVLSFVISKGPDDGVVAVKRTAYREVNEFISAGHFNNKPYG